MTTRAFRYAAKEKVALKRNAQHTFAASHALVHYGSGTVYSFIPKNACTTLRLSLAVANGCVVDVEEDWSWIHPNNETFQAGLRDLATAPYTFAVLRCPHARLASVFLDKILSHTPEFWQLFRAQGDQIDHDRFTFRDFVALVTGAPDMLSANIHWRPQIDFLVYEDYDAWLSMEAFGAAIPAIESNAFPVIDARGFSRHGTDQVRLVEEGCFADTPCLELADMRRAGQMPSHKALYDDTLTQRVAQTYADDIALYQERCGGAGLCFPDINAS